MRVERFKELTFDLLSGCGHPAIEKVEWWTDKASGLRNVVLHCTGDVSIYLWQVRTSPPGGDRFDQPEVIVIRRV